MKDNGLLCEQQAAFLCWFSRCPKISLSASTLRRFARFAGLWRGFRGTGCQHPAAISSASLASFRAEIGPADFDAGESSVSFVGSRRAHISPQCGLNGVLGDSLPVCALFMCFISPVLPKVGRPPLLPSYCQHLSQVLVFLHAGLCPAPFKFVSPRANLKGQKRTHGVRSEIGSPRTRAMKGVSYDKKRIRLPR